MIEKLKNNVKYLEINREYIIENIELFEELIVDRYRSEVRILKCDKIIEYEKLLLAMKDIIQYLIDSGTKNKQCLEELGNIDKE